MRLLRFLTRAGARLSGNRPVGNVVLNLFGGAWVGLLIVLATPWYVARLGLGGYGIVGLWMMMQVMLGLLDLGIGATVIRGLADARPDRDGLAFKRNLMRTAEWVYWVIAASLMLALVLASGWIAAHWLRADTHTADLDTVLRLIAVALGLQFPCALYSNGLTGLQAHARMNALQILGNTLRYGGGVAVLFWRVDLVWFFAVQILVAVAQTLITRHVVWRQLSQQGCGPAAFRPDIVRQLWRFSTGMAFTAVWAVLMANADRVALSRMVGTEELGKYTVAFTASGLLQLGIQPFYRAFFPRYAELVSLGDAAGLREEYYSSCRLMAVLLVPLGTLGLVFAPDLLQAWLGRQDDTITTVFRLLLVAITCSGLMWLPAAFQQAHGWTRLHTAMIAGALVFGAPIMLLAIPRLGAPGATVVWLAHGLSGITLGLWLMHRRLLPGELVHWYRSVLVFPVLTAVPLIGLSGWLMPQGLGRWAALAWITVTAVGALVPPLWYRRSRARRRAASN